MQKSLENDKKSSFVNNAQSMNRNPDENAAGRMSAKREKARDVAVPPPKNIRRRAKCLKDPLAFFSTYFPRVFYQGFTEDRRKMVEAIRHAARYGGDFALAGPRGEGKTRLAIFTSLHLVLSGQRRFPLIISKNQGKANIELANLKRELEFNDLLADDFPEVCFPIRALGGWASRARMQTVNGWNTSIEWAADHIILPSIPLDVLSGWPRKTKSLACGQIIGSMGIEGPLRGTNYRNERPDLAIIDDIDDRESARSETQTEAREEIIEKDILGLSGPGMRTARVMLCTTLNDHCIAAKYSDRRQKPSWHGVRYKAIVKMPDNEEKWEKYVEKRRGRDSEKDPDAREAHQMYLEDRAAMDAGAIVANEANFDRTTMEDGGACEVSALQHYYNLIADSSWDNFRCEYQCDPPPQNPEDASQLTSTMVASRVNGLDRCEVPIDTKCITAFLDLGHSFCHSVVTAWCEQARGFVADYRSFDVTGITRDSPKAAVERRLLATMHEWADYLTTTEFACSDTRSFPVQMGLIDSGSGSHTNAVYQFVRERGGIFMAAKGFAGERFHMPQLSRTKIPGQNWYKSYQAEAKLWLVDIDANYWKRFAQERFRTETRDEQGRIRPGTLSLHALPVPRIEQFEKDRREYSHHIVAELWNEQKGKFEERSNRNHYLDATAGACCAANMLGISLFDVPVQKRANPKERRTLAQLAGK